MKSVRFAYITDTHLGCDAAGYFLQPRYLGRYEELFRGLARWLRENDVDFVVHGGDLTDHGSPEEIRLAGERCAQLGVPVYLCLGNHDLMRPDSMRHWRELPNPLLPAGRDCFAVDAGAACVVLVSHHWHPQAEHHWDIAGPQGSRIDERQEGEITRLIQDAGRPVIAVTHAQLNAVPAAQCGMEKPFHLPDQPYFDTWCRLAERSSNLRLVMAGHNHAHSHQDHGTFISCTTAAFGEAPAQLRLITVTPSAIEAQTHTLGSLLGLPVSLDPAKAWCLEGEQTLSVKI